MMSGGVPPYQPVNPALSELMGQLKKPINASRIPLDPSNIYGRQDGAPVIGVRNQPLLHTGIDSIDQTGQRVSSLAQFGPKAIQSTLSNSFKGSVYGTICGLLIGLATQWRHFLQIVTLKPPLQALAIMGLTGITGSFLGAGIGFLQSVKQNLQEGGKILMGPKKTPAKR